MNDNREGFGVFTYAKEAPAERFEGYWKEGKHCGLGLYSWKDGSKVIKSRHLELFRGFESRYYKNVTLIDGRDVKKLYGILNLKWKMIFHHEK